MPSGRTLLGVAGARVGIVTSLTFEGSELPPEVAFVQVAYPAPDAETVVELFRQYRDYVADAPDEVASMAVYASVPPFPLVPTAFHGAPIVVYFAVYAGDPAEGEAVLAPLRTVGEPAMDLSGRQSYLAVHEIATEMFPAGNRYSWHSLYADELSEDLLGRVARAGTSKPGPETSLTLWHLGGAVGDVASEATLEGFYPGFPGFVEGEDRVRMTYGDNADGVHALATRYDPAGLLGASSTPGGTSPSRPAGSAR